MTLFLRRTGQVLAAVLVAVLVFALPAGGPGSGGTAQAQEKKQGGNLFKFLFKRDRGKAENKDVKVRRKSTKKKKATRTRSKRKVTTRRKTRSTKKRVVRKARPAKRQTARRVVPTTPKDPDARVVLVIGDFIASGLARGLRDTYAENPTIAVVEKSMASSGLVRDDHYDWQANAEKALESEPRVDVVAVVVGSNDSQGFRKPAITFRTEEWTAAYRQRAETLIKAFSDAGKPVVWLSVPPMKKTSLTRNIAFLNDIQAQAATEKPGVTYVDIWDGFADENGGYISTGPDEKGQVRRLRSSDGINLASAGRSKIAFYARQEIDKILGGAAPAIAALQVAPDEQEKATEQMPTRPDVWEMVLTGEPEPENALTLAGATTSIPTLQSRAGDSDGALTSRRLREGLPPAPRIGRIDDFSNGEGDAPPRL